MPIPKTKPLNQPRIPTISNDPKTQKAYEYLIEKYDALFKKLAETPTSMVNNPQTYVEISSSAFNHNVSYYKNKIGLHNNLAVVIKGNGYGHGLQQMAQLCAQNALVDWVCVAQLSEALALQNITKPILVLGYSDVSPELAIGRNIHFMVDNLEYAHQLNAIGKE